MNIVAIVDFFGYIGVVLMLIAYYLLNKGSLSSKHFAYPFLNLLGSVLVTISLLFTWNAPAFLIEAAWVLVSFYGLVKVLRHPLQ